MEYLHARPRPRGHLGAGAGEPGRAHVLDADNGARLHGLEAGFEQELFRERVTHLHRGPALLRALFKGGRSHGGAMDAVASGLGADVEDGIARSLGAGAEDPVLSDEPDGHGVDERIARVLGSERDLAAQVWDAEAVAVPADARHHAFDESPAPGVLHGREAELVEHGHWPRAHGKNVAQDAAPVAAPWKGSMNDGWLALDLESQREVAPRSTMPAFAGPLQHGRAVWGSPQEDASL